MAPTDDVQTVSYETHDGQVFQRHPCGMLTFAGAAATMGDNRQRAWEKTLDWPTVGPKLIAALEDISWALISEKPAAAQSIIDKVFREIGRNELDAPGEESGQS